MNTLNRSGIREGRHVDHRSAVIGSGSLGAGWWGGGMVDSVPLLIVLAFFAAIDIGTALIR